ncbi:hypothetical protein AJ78_07476 [Emergomyces pasteurianus Ep9510]|uniref:Uncharacterized protein n=1 Tax=Emergomyces pasteurianus Ep9510 TaxID=1447872 RepID=A0A1J9P7G1_9EURO|nr:hypothetical protein AJ78_07476 [Emergomyces pasteurianus Ep9510]
MAVSRRKTCTYAGQISTPSHSFQNLNKRWGFSPPQGTTVSLAQPQFGTAAPHIANPPQAPIQTSGCPQQAIALSNNQHGIALIFPESNSIPPDYSEYLEALPWTPPPILGCPTRSHPALTISVALSLPAQPAERKKNA